MQEAREVGFRSVLVPLAAPSDTKAVVGRALAVSRRLDAHADVVFVRPDPEETFAYTGLEPADFDAMTREARDTVDSHGRKSADRARHLFYAACDDAGVPRNHSAKGAEAAKANWHVVKGEPTFVVPDIARSADLAIFSGALARYTLLFENVLEATLVRSGTPVLLMPERSADPCLDHAMIAWDGGTSSARALSAWLASGLATSSATILYVSEGEEQQPNLQGIQVRLLRHGVEAEVIVRRRGFDLVGETLLKTAQALGAGLLVMGGYGRSRYREAIFGGVTRHVIRHANLPVLLMH